MSQSNGQTAESCFTLGTAGKPRMVLVQNQMCPQYPRVEKIHSFLFRKEEAGFLYSGESHPVMELLCVLEGSLHSVAEGQDILLQSGDMVVYGPGQWHMQYADMDVCPGYFAIAFEISGAEWEQLLNRRFSADSTMMNVVRGMLAERETGDACSEAMILSQLNILILHLLRQAENDVDQAAMIAGGTSGENQIICRAQQYIGMHVREKLSVPLVADHVGVSPSYLTALFHKNLGIAPGEYIRRMKLQESKWLILEGELTFTQIAQMLQYSTVHHFSRQFKDKYGITPSEYGKSLRG